MTCNYTSSSESWTTLCLFDLLAAGEEPPFSPSDSESSTAGESLWSASWFEASSSLRGSNILKSLAVLRLACLNRLTLLLLLS
ncbi:hypothetical protein Pint_24484 [Pistacia integerrima]|uniref:Uncharacterized protein n=1 Tax=Pistacia integerrima TaxID=434235 RepID=A0ACC0YBG5_9ROSI|nr:hypothetical protein Pint_24484 [Pistacia integerrima]